MVHICTLLLIHVPVLESSEKFPYAVLSYAVAVMWVEVVPGASTLRRCSDTIYGRGVQKVTQLPCRLVLLVLKM